jgi:hypothetical protein
MKSILLIKKLSWDFPNHFVYSIKEKDVRVLTPKERAELIALANAEFDSAIARAKKLVQKNIRNCLTNKGN